MGTAIQPYTEVKVLTGNYLNQTGTVVGYHKGNRPYEVLFPDGKTSKYATDEMEIVNES